MDIMKVAPGLYQYTAIDDCTRMKVIALYPRKTSRNSVDFLINRVMEDLPFPIQRIQTDRGREWFAYEFQEALMDCHIKFRPIKPFSPHLNGKVERTQKTDLEEFYATVRLDDPNIHELLEQWQIYYNSERPHSSLNNLSPQEKWLDLCNKTPLHEEVWNAFDIENETYRVQNYKMDSILSKLKRS